MEKTRLTTAVAAAEQDVEIRTRTDRAAWQKLQAANNGRLVAEQASQIVEQRRFGFERTTFGIVALLALAAGAIVTWMGNGKNHVFASVEQAQANLPIPVVGVLSNNFRRDEAHGNHGYGNHGHGNHGHGKTGYGAVPQWIPWVRTGSEVTLAIVFVAAIAAAIADHNFLSQFASDPLTCYQETVEHLMR